MKSKRNQPCSCGSGMKFKSCCALKRTPSQWLALVSVAAFAIGAVWIVAGVVRKSATTDLSAPAGKVWSEEHGHWHDAQDPGAAAPAGEAPAGKVWSEEHGHWHDAPKSAGGPAEEAPPGKVWSEEHGHWHDANAATDLPQLPPLPPADEPEAGSVWPESVSEPE